MTNSTMQNGASQSSLKHGDWEDFPEFPGYHELEVITFDDSNTERYTESKVVEVSKVTESLLQNKCTKRLPNNTCLKTRNTFALLNWTTT